LPFGGCGSDDPAASQAGTGGAGGAVTAGGSAGGGVDGGSAGTGSPTPTGGAAGDTTDCAAPTEPTASDDATEMPSADPELAGATHQFFEIVVKSSGGTPLRGATLRTVNDIEYVSDDNGVVAFYEPGLMDQEVFFQVSHPGFEYAADGFGFHGKALLVSEGGSAELVLQQTSGTAGAAQGDLQSRLLSANVPGPEQCFAIRVHDAASLRGVPLVSLETQGERLWSDSQGLIAYCDPDHLPAELAFEVFSHGYELADGGSTVTLDAVAGGSAEVALTRTNVAERLYRLTGGGIYRDSVLLGLETPLAEPVLNAKVMGQDTASAALYRGKLFWLWQDTDRVAYPLGNFRGTAATSALPGVGFAPNLGPDLDYFEGDDGFGKPMCPDCPALAWMDGLISVPDDDGNERLFGGYAIASSEGSFSETGVVLFDDDSETFERVITDFNDRQDFTRPDAHPFRFRHGQAEYVYYGNRLRIPARADAYLDPSSYERFTPYAAGAVEPETNADGSPHYEWRAAGIAATPELLSADGVGSEHDLDGHLLQADSGDALNVVGAAATWNRHSKRFLRIGQQLYGDSSALGEIWIAQADTPVGPWLYAQKVVSHLTYTFYNTLFHPEFEQGTFAYFEGTYTSTYSGAPVVTPRYDYNQILYRVDLEGPAMNLPVAVYALGEETPLDLVTKRGLRRASPELAAAFLALERPREDAVAIAWSGPSCSADRRLEATSSPATAPLFYALPTDAEGDGTAPLYEYTHADGRRAYALDGAALAEGFERADTALALVWESPVRVALPVSDYLGDLVAEAGPDQCLQATDDAPVAVTLDGSGSEVIGGTITRYLWRVADAEPCEYIEGPSVTFELAPGLHTVELEITDDAGNVSRDSLTIEVS
jgi:hypothetical protein